MQVGGDRGVIGARGQSCTGDPRFRKTLLYSAELREHGDRKCLLLRDRKCLVPSTGLEPAYDAG